MQKTLLVGLSLATLWSASVAFAQQERKTHSWDVLMNRPEAKGAAQKLLGHCGDAETQDVMNACFALEFSNADAEMNKTYRTILGTLDNSERQQVRSAQLAWLRYRDLHCQAVGDLHFGGGSLEPTEIFGCKADLTKARTKEITTGYRSVEETH